MRATRAYLAGFGTAGSLLAGAAMLFVLASAVVAVKGWPQINYRGSVASLSLTDPRASSRAIVLAPIQSTRHAAIHAAATRGAISGASIASTPTVSRTHSQPVSSRPAVSATPGTSTPPQQAPAANTQVTSAPRPAPTNAGGCTSCSTSSTPSSPPSPADQLNSVVQGATNTVQNTVSNATQNLNSTVNQVVNGLP